MLEGVTCRDLERLLDCESLKPALFSSYLKLLNFVHEIQLDCSETLPNFFQEDDFQLPKWAQPVSGWNKVVVLDPPTLEKLVVPVLLETVSNADGDEDDESQTL